MENIIIITTVFVVCLICSVRSNVPSLQINSGTIKGTKLYTKDGKGPITAFLGVPYAEPPVNDLRFAPPRPVKAWNGVWNATQHGPNCPQDMKRALEIYHPIQMQNPEISEDCLYLNIYSPGVNGLHPVLVWIHGGSNFFGSGSMYDGTALAAYQDIVVVSINYRLGILGFLYVGDDEKTTGNFGFLDQQMALKWVQENIASFGGDANRVTLAGESYGSFTVSWHLLTPSSDGLFHRAIMQSGSALTQPLVDVQSPTKAAEEFATLLGCTTGDPASMLTCLRAKPDKDILANQLGLRMPALTAKTVMDGKPIPSNPKELYQSLNYSKVDLMAGITSCEGYVLARMIFPHILDLLDSTLTYKVVKDTLKEYFSALYAHHSDDVVETILGFYIGKSTRNRNDPNFLRSSTIDLLGDSLNGAPTYQAALLHADGGVQNVFFYDFSHRPYFVAPSRPKWHKGTDHGHEMLFTWGMPLLKGALPNDVEFDDLEVTFSKEVMTYWANFVKTGNPNSEELPDWPRLTPADEQYFIIQPSFFSSRRYKPSRVQFWNSKVPFIASRPKLRSKHDEL